MYTLTYIEQITFSTTPINFIKQNYQILSLKQYDELMIDQSEFDYFIVYECHKI